MPTAYVIRRVLRETPSEKVEPYYYLKRDVLTTSSGSSRPNLMGCKLGGFIRSQPFVKLYCNSCATFATTEVI